jgi:hypothetical protein
MNETPLTVFSTPSSFRMSMKQYSSFFQLDEVDNVNEEDDANQNLERSLGRQKRVLGTTFLLFYGVNINYIGKLFPDSNGSCRCDDFFL